MPFSKLQCQCRGPPIEGTEGAEQEKVQWSETELEQPHDCVKAGFEVINDKGVLTCTGTPDTPNVTSNGLVHGHLRD